MRNYRGESVLVCMCVKLQGDKSEFVSVIRGVNQGLCEILGGGEG